ncbi:MAG: HyaD/HybD family hydrogenase maturation endopeptidase [Gemmatimonadota bacterium]|nr:HyaD/HybD family hydrogenase maturation endopeptidase [Gemmatimonadota bacterium]
MTTYRDPGSLLILGLGNVLCGDDGLGIAAVELLRQQHEIPIGVRVVDGGTLGLALLSQFEATDDVVLVDAVQTDGQPGSFVRLEGDDVGPAVRSRLSCHQVGVADLLDALRWLGSYPRRVVLLGLVPESLDVRVARSAAVERQMPRLVQGIVEEADRMGYGPFPDTDGATVPLGRRGPAARALGL